MSGYSAQKQMVSTWYGSLKTKSRLGDIRYDEVKDQTYIIDDWYRQEGAAMSKLGFWGRIIKEGGRVKFQPVDRLINSFEIDRYPMRVSQGNHEEFKNLANKIENSNAKLIYDVWGMYKKEDIPSLKYLRLGMN